MLMPNFGVTNKDHYMCVMIFSGVVTCSSRLQGIAICKFLGWKNLVKYIQSVIESPTGNQYSRNTSHVKQYIREGDPTPQQGFCLINDCVFDRKSQSKTNFHVLTWRHFKPIARVAKKSRSFAN